MDIVIPDSVEEIDQIAFYSCTSLENVVISKNVTKMAESAFGFCRMLSNIDIYSYRVFSMLDEWLKARAIISTIKNYYTGKIKYSDEDMNNFKEYIRENKVKLFESIQNNKEVLKFTLIEMNNFYSYGEIIGLLSREKFNDAEINALLLEYNNRNFDLNKVNPLDNLDLGEMDYTSEKGNQKTKQ